MTDASCRALLPPFFSDGLSQRCSVDKRVVVDSLCCATTRTLVTPQSCAGACSCCCCSCCFLFALFLLLLLLSLPGCMVSLSVVAVVGQGCVHWLVWYSYFRSCGHVLTKWHIATNDLVKSCQSPFVADPIFFTHLVIRRKYPPYRETPVAQPLSHCVFCGIVDYRCYTPTSFRKNGLSQSKNSPWVVSQQKLASEAYRTTRGVA